MCARSHRPRRSFGGRRLVSRRHTQRTKPRTMRGFRRLRVHQSLPFRQEWGRASRAFWEPTKNPVGFPRGFDSSRSSYEFIETASRTPTGKPASAGVGLDGPTAPAGVSDDHRPRRTSSSARDRTACARSPGPSEIPPARTQDPDHAGWPADLDVRSLGAR
jgi:hypothetical protein